MVVPDQLDRGVVRLRARALEDRLRHGLGRDRQQLLRQIDHQGMRGLAEGVVVAELLHLVVGGAREALGGGEAQRCAPEAGRGLDVILAGVVEDAAALAARDHQRPFVPQLAQICLRVDVVGDIPRGGRVWQQRAHRGTSFGKHRGGAVIITRLARSLQICVGEQRFRALYRRVGVLCWHAKDSERRGQERSDQTTKYGGRTMRGEGRSHVVGKLAVLIGALVMAPTPFMATPAQAQDTIKIGWVGPLSPPGGYAEGALMKQSAEMAAEEINAKGGLLGKKIQIVFQDTRGQPEEGAAAAERRTPQDKVVAITGEFHSSVFLAEMEVAHKAGIPIIAVDVWALKITAKGYPEVFRVAPNQALIATKCGDWMAAAGSKNVAVMFEKTDGGQSGRDVLLPVLDKHGIKYEVVGADPSATEFTAQIERFKSHQPPFDFFMTDYSESGAYPMISQASQLGFAPTPQTGIGNSGGPAVDPTFWKNVGKAGIGLVTEVVSLPKAADN